MRAGSGGGVGRAAARAVYREGSNCGDWKAGHGAHGEHGGHGCDIGRVETQWLVERLRILPSPKGRGAKGKACERGRRGPGEGRVRDVGGASSVQEACLEMGGKGTERTANMLDMVVTLGVLRLSGWLNVFALCRVGGGGLQNGRWEGGKAAAARGESVQGESPDWRLEARARSALETSGTCL